MNPHANACGFFYAINNNLPHTHHTRRHLPRPHQPTTQRTHKSPLFLQRTYLNTQSHTTPPNTSKTHHILKQFTHHKHAPNRHQQTPADAPQPPHQNQPQHTPAYTCKAPEQDTTNSTTKRTHNCTQQQHPHTGPNTRRTLFRIGNFCTIPGTLF